MSSSAAASASAATVDAPADRGSTVLLRVFAAVTLTFFVATARDDGDFRDELYYLVNGSTWALVTPSTRRIGALAALVRATLGDTLFCHPPVRALAGAATVWAGRCDGPRARRRPLRPGAGDCLHPPRSEYLSQFSNLSMNPFDILFWAVAWWLLVRLFKTGSRGSARLRAGGRRRRGEQDQHPLPRLRGGGGAGGRPPLGSFRSPWFWLGCALAAALFAPYVIWNAATAGPPCSSWTTPGA